MYKEFSKIAIPIILFLDFKSHSSITPFSPAMPRTSIGWLMAMEFIEAAEVSKGLTNLPSNKLSRYISFVLPTENKSQLVL